MVSTDEHNHQHARAHGLCVVVPFSSEPPESPRAHEVYIQLSKYRSFTADVWAQCDALMQVSHGRLDRIAAGRGFIATETLLPEDAALIEVGVRGVLGL